MRRAKTGKPNRFLFWLVSLVTRIVAKVVFRRRVLRNELKGAKGPFVVIANHQTKLDFVNLFDLAGQPVHFVISDCFYSTLPFQGVMDRLGMIPKQQFQTTLTDIRRMKSVVDEGRGLVIYPAGLMCEDGLSTPIPAATYRFLSWMRADVYVARTTGTYFVRPKWSKRNRPGRTYMDVYKLFSAEDLETLPVEEIRERADNALLFDAYREQEEHKIKYHKSYDLEGLVRQISETLLDMAFVRENRISPTELVARELLLATRSRFVTRAHEKDLTVTVTGGEFLVSGDKLLLELLLTNLTENACKACPEGGHVELGAMVTEEGKTLFVKDDGNGMTPEQLAHITTPFYRTDRSRNRKEGGTGLGLALCERIAAAHGATLTFTSALGEGTTAYLIFGKKNFEKTENFTTP